MNRRIRTLALELLLPVAVVVIWWFASEDSDSPYFPPLRENLKTFREVWFFDKFWSDLVPSLAHFTVGFIVAMIVGVVLGTLLGLSSRTRRNVMPITEFFRAMPVPALMPVALLLIGLGSKMEITLIAFGCVWPILISTADGVRGVEPAMLDMARVYGLSPFQRVIKVTLPAASPRIVAGLRIALAIGLAAMVVVSMIAGSRGLGSFIIRTQRFFDLTGMWAGIFMVGILGYVVNLGFVTFERRFLAWHRGWRATKEGL